MRRPNRKIDRLSESLDCADQIDGRAITMANLLVVAIRSSDDPNHQDA
jgi:hypothetical protein